MSGRVESIALSQTHEEAPMEIIHYVGLDVHKKTIAYCIKTVSGQTVRQGVVSAERKALRQWLNELPGPWMGAMEATLFTGWIYDFASCGRA